MNGSRHRLILTGVVTLAYLSQPAANAWLSADERENASLDNSVLERELGTWDTTIRTWPHGNLGRAVVYKGVEVNILTSDGKGFRRTCEAAPFADKHPSGFQEVTGHGLVLRYDACSRKFVGGWNDVADEKLMGRVAGKYDAKSSTLTLVYTPLKPKIGEERHVTQYIDANTKKFKLSFVITDSATKKSYTFTAFEIIAKRRIAGSRK